MNARDKELSLAIDALLNLRMEIAKNHFWHFGELADDALRHVELAASMPKSSRIRSLMPWNWKKR